MRSTKELLKVPEFSGGKGCSGPEDAETWLRSVARAVKINRWLVEEAFVIVQAKLIGPAATWYQNKELLFDLNLEGFR